MAEILSERPKVPGMVIFVSILNFLWVFFAALAVLLSGALVIFGNTLGIYEAVTHQIQQMTPASTVTPGLSLIFGVVAVFSLLIGSFFFAVGQGLLRGKKMAWYAQVMMSVLGLFGFPIGTVLNGIILYFFFQPPIRNYFKV